MNFFLRKTNLLLVISILSLTILGVVSFHTIEKLKVNGKLYYKIREGKDLVADILPPSQFILESYLSTYEMLNAKSDNELSGHIDHYLKLKKEYYNRNLYWSNILEQGEVKKNLIQLSFEPADRFYRKIDNELIPLLRNKEKEKAKEIIVQEIRPLYDEHRKFIDEIVKLSNKQNLDIEKDAKSEIKVSYIVLLIFLFSIMVVNVIFSFINKKHGKENLELLKAKEKIEASDRLKSAFLANMSHEIRTPMNGILGFSELLKNAELTGEQQQEYIRIIEKSGTRMLNIINDIIDISKIEAGLIKLNIKESNINEQIEYIFTFFKPEVEDKGIKLSYKNSLPLKEAIIQTDREKVFAILTNLVKNAIKYTNKGTIEFGYVLTGPPTQLMELQFYVKDTGIGIPKDRQEAIFERFIQADIEDVHAQQGAGLGLAITKSYVEMLGGKVWVESEEGIGSTFYFTLPYNPDLEENIVNQKDIHSDSTLPHTPNLKILIVEDDEISKILISLTIKEFVGEIMEAKNGVEAVKICRNNPDLDLILMDIKIPDLNGYEATRQIRQFNKHVVIIAQTAFGLSGDREKATAAGCNDYIAKPIIKSELHSLIQKYFEQEPAIN